MPHTSDGVMHTIRFAAYYKEFMAGQFPVRWAHQFHYGYGTVLFNFVAPLAYVVSLPFIAIGLPLTAILKISFALTHIVGGVCMYLFGEKLFKSQKAAFVVALLYQFAPFRLVEMNVRGNLGSLYAYVLVPLLFFAILKMKDKVQYSSFVLTALSVALLALSHTILGYSFIALGALFCLLFSKNIKALFIYMSAFLTGIALAAFFIFPALLEQKFTNGYLFSKDVYLDHFPAWYKFIIPNFFDSQALRVAEISVQIGLFHLLSFCILVYLLLAKKIKKSQRAIVVFLIGITVVTFAFMQPIAKPLWEHIKLIRQFQFPWRFLAIIVFTTTVGAGYVFVSLKKLTQKYVFIGLIFLIALSTLCYWRPTQGFDKPDETLYWSYPLTTNYFSEVNSIWMGEEPTTYSSKKVEIIGRGAQITNVVYDSTRHSFTTTSLQKSMVIDHTFFFPGWKLKLDDKPAAIQFQDPHYRGLITFEVPPGTHKITVQFEQSKIQWLGNYVSLFTLLTLILFAPLKALYKKIKRA
jgi:hypothetical protein